MSQITRTLAQAYSRLQSVVRVAQSSSCARNMYSNASSIRAMTTSFSGLQHISAPHHHHHHQQQQPQPSYMDVISFVPASSTADCELWKAMTDNNKKGDLVLASNLLNMDKFYIH
eukprot:TRINITY_DN9556_c1_g1_i1.p1 TRINITY_DN9556_c1_g1~~TRINITY_DN9556_c1_g1_i1.p1  ORF type:complete len:115 (-),score=39.96 TRINITY_DN9556_c1_g1_i1:41-385(-)